MTATLAAATDAGIAPRMAGGYEVVHFVTLEDSQGFFYLMTPDGGTPRWTMEHDDAHDFCSDEAATTAASAFSHCAGSDGKVSTLCSARRQFVPTLISEASLPEEFRSENMFGGTEEEFKARSARFRAYCAANGIFYYGRPRESFSKWEAWQLAKQAGATKLLLDDLS